MVFLLVLTDTSKTDTNKGAIMALTDTPARRVMMPLTDIDPKGCALGVDSSQRHQRVED